MWRRKAAKKHFFAAANAMALATVIVPFPAGQPAFMPGQPVVCWTGDEVSVDFKAGKAYLARYHTREKQLLCHSRNSEEGI